MNLDAVRSRLPAILAVLFMGGLVAVGLSMSSPDHDAVLDAAMEDLLAQETVSGTIRIETLVASDALGIVAKDVPVIRLPIGVAGPFRISMKDGKPLFAAELSLALEGGETLPDAPGVDLVTDGHDVTYVRPKNLPMKVFNGRWMRVSSAQFAELTGGDVAVVTEDGSTPRDPDLAPLKAVLSDAFFSTTRTMASEEIGGIPTRHYGVAIDAAKLSALVEAANAQFLGRDLTAADREALSRVTAGFELVMEAWVDKDAPVLRKFGFDLRPLAGNDAAPVRVIIVTGPKGLPVKDAVPAQAEDLMETFLKELGGDALPS